MSLCGSVLSAFCALIDTIASVRLALFSLFSLRSVILICLSMCYVKATAGQKCACYLIYSGSLLCAFNFLMNGQSIEFILHPLRSYAG